MPSACFGGVDHGVGDGAACGVKRVKPDCGMLEAQTKAECGIGGAQDGFGRRDDLWPDAIAVQQQQLHA